MRHEFGNSPTIALAAHGGPSLSAAEGPLYRRLLLSAWPRYMPWRYIYGSSVYRAVNSNDRVKEFMAVVHFLKAFSTWKDVSDGVGPRLRFMEFSDGSLV